MVPLSQDLPYQCSTFSSELDGVVAELLLVVQNKTEHRMDNTQAATAGDNTAK